MWCNSYMGLVKRIINALAFLALVAAVLVGLYFWSFYASSRVDHVPLDDLQPSEVASISIHLRDVETRKPTGTYRVIDRQSIERLVLSIRNANLSWITPMYPAVSGNQYNLSFHGIDSDLAYLTAGIGLGIETGHGDHQRAVAFMSEEHHRSLINAIDLAVETAGGLPPALQR